ncbi:MAG: hypothetical protein ACFE9T_04770 [Promethearchaeota archaeon]
MSSPFKKCRIFSPSNVINSDEPNLICLKESRALTLDLSPGSLRNMRYIHKLEANFFHIIVKVSNGEEKMQ